MPHDPARTHLYHITDVSNLPSIIASGGLLSDVAVSQITHQVIGYGNIKHRRMTQYRIPCSGGRFVGEFVPFYFCPRSPMLFTVNNGNTGLPPGCQASIVHLVTTVDAAVKLGRQFAISDVNAGSGYATFRNDLGALDDPGHLDWAAINTNQWKGKMHLKQAEFLVADRFELGAISCIGCHNAQTAAQVAQIFARCSANPLVRIEPSWYY